MDGEQRRADRFDDDERPPGPWAVARELGSLSSKLDLMNQRMSTMEKSMGNIVKILITVGIGVVLGVVSLLWSGSAGL